MSSRKQPNPLQKLVRGAIRDLINQVNSQKTAQPKKSKTQKSAPKLLHFITNKFTAF